MRGGALALAAVPSFGLSAAACSPSGGKPPGTVATPAPGRLVFLAETCPTCHGHGREGTNTGPALDRLRRHWDEDTLVRFLHNPAAFKLLDPRLAALAQRYRSDMPPLFAADERRVRALARYLLQE
ncbi:MAG TPA: c-type cytochrome [Thermoanaerobaculaceae bacterium]|nr:c-type cytochrome [Thermoanaerobaculaceae bacterium]